MGSPWLLAEVPHGMLMRFVGVLEGPPAGGAASPRGLDACASNSSASFRTLPRGTIRPRFPRPAEPGGGGLLPAGGEGAHDDKSCCLRSVVGHKQRPLVEAVVPDQGY